MLPEREAPRAHEVPPDALGFLRALGGPTWLRQRGRDDSRRRVVSTLLHGNEPSGLRALHAWLREGRKPAVDVLFFVGAVDAALEPPGWAFRHLPERRDLNRCFAPPFEGPEGLLAEALLEQIEAARPEALLDLHNNTGHNPPYGVGAAVGRAELRLASLFGERFVHSPLRLGGLVETTAAHCPSVTIECGRAGDPNADRVAHDGLSAFLTRDLLDPAGAPDPKMQVLVDPVRVRVRPGATLAFDERPAADFDLTVTHDVDRHNFERLDVGTTIGWVRQSGDWPLEARDATGAERSRELFEAHDGALRTRRELIPIMMTTHPRIALDDCLFYTVQEQDPAGVRR